jgi:hypothetical protein
VRRWGPTVVALLVLLGVAPGFVAGGSLSVEVDGIRAELNSKPERPGLGSAVTIGGDGRAPTAGR